MPGVARPAPPTCRDLLGQDAVCGPGGELPPASLRPRLESESSADLPPVYHLARLFHGGSTGTLFSPPLDVAHSVTDQVATLRPIPGSKTLGHSLARSQDCETFSKAAASL